MTDAEVIAHFPVQGWRLKCGLRVDLPKKERVHDPVRLGTEQQNSGTANGYIHGTVYACYKCGFHRFRAWKGPKLQAVLEFTTGAKHRNLQSALTSIGIGE